MKWVIDHWRAQQETNLVACHSDLYLIEVVLLDEIALRNVGAIHAAGAQRHNEEQDYED